MKNLVDEREVLLENIDPNDDKDDIEGYIKDFVNDSQNIMSRDEIKNKIQEYLNDAGSEYKGEGDEESKIKIDFEKNSIVTVSKN